MPGPDDPSRSYLRCLICGQTTEPAPTDELNDLAGWWPQCCNEVMAAVVAETVTSKPPEPA